MIILLGYKLQFCNNLLHFSKAISLQIEYNLFVVRISRIGLFQHVGGRRQQKQDKGKMCIWHEEEYKDRYIAKFESLRIVSQHQP